MVKTTFIYGLYSTGDINNIRYIGKTVQDVRKRLYEHLHETKVSYKINWINSELSKGNAIKIVVLDEVWNEDWDFWELFWIQEYSRRGYKLTNISPGGYQSNNMVSVVALNLNNKFLGEFNSISQAARHFNIDSRAVASCVRGNIRTYNNKVFIAKDNYSKEKDYSTVKNPSDQLKKCTYQYDLQGNFLKEWSSAKEATTFYSLGRSAIPLSATGRQITAGGYIWLYEKNEEEVNNRLRKLKKVPNENAVNVYYKDSGELVGSFYNKASACKMLGLNYKQFLKGICERGFYKNYKV